MTNAGQSVVDLVEVPFGKIPGARTSLVKWVDIVADRLGVAGGIDQALE
jgi:hypothetical protein